MVSKLVSKANSKSSILTRLLTYCDSALLIISNKDFILKNIIAKIFSTEENKHKQCWAILSRENICFGEKKKLQIKQKNIYL